DAVLAQGAAIPTAAPRRSVLEALADLVDRRLGHELGAGVEVGGGDAAVDLQIELHHRPETLQEGLLAERAGEGAGADLLLLLGTEVEAEGADFFVELELADGVAQGRRDKAVGGEGADHVLAALEQRDDRADDVV